MLEIEIYRVFARYNRHINQQLLAACEKLPATAIIQASGAPFGSILGIWNHLLVTDRLWLARFAAAPLPYSSLDFAVCADLPQVRHERALTDDAIEEFVAGLSTEKLIEPLTFMAMSQPISRTMPLWILVSHLFNHQTHHRGQLTALIEQAGGDCGVTDLPAMPCLEVD